MKFVFCTKQTHSQFHKSENKAQNLFDLIHFDSWDPYQVLSSCGAHYFLPIVDGASRAVWVYLMKDRKETSYVVLL